MRTFDSTSNYTVIPKSLPTIIWLNFLKYIFWVNQFITTKIIFKRVKKYVIRRPDGKRTRRVWRPNVFLYLECFNQWCRGAKLVFSFEETFYYESYGNDPLIESAKSYSPLLESPTVVVGQVDGIVESGSKKILFTVRKRKKNGHPGAATRRRRTKRGKEAGFSQE